MDAMEDMEVNNGSNTVLAPDCQVNNLFTISRSVTHGVPETFVKLLIKIEEKYHFIPYFLKALHKSILANLRMNGGPN